jgi:hypothetical protein
MKVSFDGLRRNIAEDFNHLVLHMGLIETVNRDYYRGLVDDLRKSLGCLMACYDSKEMPEDFNDLSEEIKLSEL